MTRTITAISFAIVVAAAGTARASGPKGKVTPNNQLTDGQTVKVTGSGFSPNESLYVVECNRTARKSGEAACNLDNLVSTTSNAKGRVPATKYTVTTGVIGNGSCGTKKADKKCYIAISNEDLTEVALVGIMFTVP